MMEFVKFSSLFLITLLGVVLHCTPGHAQDPGNEEIITDRQIVKAVVESCSSCILSRLPEVRAFVNDDLPLFHNVQFDRKPGAPPNLYLLNKDGQRVETINLTQLTREQCNQHLLRRGFYKKTFRDEAVPEEFLNGPYTPREEL